MPGPRGGIEIRTNGSLVVEIGGIATELRTQNDAFRELLASRYRGFLNAEARPQCRFEVELHEPSDESAGDEELEVRMDRGVWEFHRGDFTATWDPQSGDGRVRQSSNPYAIDSVLRIIHSLILASVEGMLIHAASAIREGKAFLFSGVSGAGKTTISRLAPSNAILLSDEISFVRRTAKEFLAFGTPFSGELAKAGENCSAPLDTIFLLKQGSDNCIEDLSPADAVRELMRNILFFAHDPGLVEQVFASVVRLVDEVQVQRLIFLPDARVWEIIRPSVGATT